MRFPAGKRALCRAPGDCKKQPLFPDMVIIAQKSGRVNAGMAPEHKPQVKFYIGAVNGLFMDLPGGI